MGFINWCAKCAKVVYTEDRHLKMISKRYAYIKTSNPKLTCYLHTDMNGNLYIIPWNWLRHVKRDDNWIVGKTSLYELYIRNDYWLMSKILLTLTHFPQSYKTYNSAHVLNALIEKPTYLHNITNKMLSSTHNISHNTGIWFTLYLIYLIKYSIFYDFNKQMLIYL